MSHVPGSLIAKRLRNAARLIQTVGPGYPLRVFLGEAHSFEIVEGPPLDARNEFVALLKAGFETQTMETFPSGPTDTLFATPIPCNGVVLTVANPGGTYDPTFYFYTDNLTFQGRWNTTPGGVNYIQAVSSVPDDSGNLQLRFLFSEPISFFGAYFTDIGDFSGQVTARLNDSDGGSTTHELNISITPFDGDLTFFGFADKQKTYTSIDFFCSVGLTEAWGMDDLIFGTAALLA